LHWTSFMDGTTADVFYGRSLMTIFFTLCRQQFTVETTRRKSYRWYFDKGTIYKT